MSGEDGLAAGDLKEDGTRERGRKWTEHVGEVAERLPESPATASMGFGERPHKRPKRRAHLWARAALGLPPPPALSGTPISKSRLSLCS